MNSTEGRPMGALSRIESSANINTNPSTEQTCITVDGGLARYYKGYYDGINDFGGRFKGWTPYDLDG